MILYLCKFVLAFKTFSRVFGKTVDLNVSRVCRSFVVKKPSSILTILNPVGKIAEKSSL